MAWASLVRPEAIGIYLEVMFAVPLLGISRFWSKTFLKECKLRGWDEFLSIFDMLDWSDPLSIMMLWAVSRLGSSIAISICLKTCSRGEELPMPDSQDLRDLEFDSGMTPELRWFSWIFTKGLGSCFSDSSCSRPETHDWRDLDFDMAFKLELRGYSTACSTTSKFR